jgi:hypothetical protein
MKHARWQIILGLLLVLLSAGFYLIHYALFRDTHHIFIYLVGDIAFVPVEVLLVTLIIHRLLEVNEKKRRLEKLNMVIEVFFSEVGTRLLRHFSGCDPRIGDIRKALLISSGWSEKDFAKVGKMLKDHEHGVDIDRVDLTELHAFVIGKRNFLMRLMENPNLFEHESFTELLMAVFHLAEELESRDDLTRLPDSDRKHIAGDIIRIYSLLVLRWVDYMKHLKDNYPYLFSLAIRTNPFDENASPLVK